MSNALRPRPPPCPMLTRPPCAARLLPPPGKKDQQLNRAVGLDTKGCSTAIDREKPSHLSFHGIPCPSTPFHAVPRPSRYSTAGDREKRTGEAGGFREFDDEEEVRRKRRAAEAAQEVAERKAERKKCEFCKRFSCIC